MFKKSLNFKIKQIKQSLARKAEIIFVFLNESPVPLIKFIIKRVSNEFNQKTEVYYESINSISSIIFQFRQLGTFHQTFSYDQGNPQNFTSIVLNFSSELLLNINFTKENIKQLLELHKSWDKSIQNIKQSISIKLRSPSRIFRNCSIAQSAIEKWCVWLFVLLIIKQDMKLNQPLLIKLQRRLILQLSLLINNLDQNAQKIWRKRCFQFAQDLLISKKQITQTFVEIKLNQEKWSTRQVCLINRHQQKILSISSDILFFKYSQSDIQLKLINKITQSQELLNILKNEKTYIPFFQDLNILKWDFALKEWTFTNLQ
ncbi:unnamed protein product [Paramecium sonneborni]|uniref:Uncharacterized protein n=1 Tax=Paramecium sonneborni TaxID=65129 RepID=A0A8S1RRG4_9CILI|nr:unnamed protein product [Paramecium sonneborni]